MDTRIFDSNGNPPPGKGLLLLTLNEGKSSHALGAPEPYAYLPVANGASSCSFELHTAVETDSGVPVASYVEITHCSGSGEGSTAYEAYWEVKSLSATATYTGSGSSWVPSRSAPYTLEL